MWNRDNKGECTISTHDGNKVTSEVTRPLLERGCDVFIRNNNLVSIFEKVQKFKEKSFKDVVSPRKPYGLAGDFFKDPKKYNLPQISTKPIENGMTIYGLDDHLKRVVRYIPKSYPLPRKDYVSGYKMFMARNQGSGLFGEVFSTPIFGKPNDCCTETFIVIGSFDSYEKMMNCFSYIKTKFFRALIGVKKNDQGAAQGIYQFVPLQDFSKPWTDKELYKRYGLTEDEISFIENNVKEMK